MTYVIEMFNSNLSSCLKETTTWNKFYRNGLHKSNYLNGILITFFSIKRIKVTEPNQSNSLILLFTATVEASSCAYR